MLVFMVMILGLMDFGRMVWSYTMVSHGAREATRYAVVHGSDSKSACGPTHRQDCLPHIAQLQRTF